MHFKVTGSDSHGTDKTLYVIAENEADAARRSRELGVFPYKVVRDRRAEELHRKEVESREATEREREARAVKEARIQQRVALRKESLRQRLEAGGKAFLYESIFVPVDSMLLDKRVGNAFDIELAAAAGLDGWEIVGVVPRTLGVGLTNENLRTVGGVVPIRESTVWAGGIGGNVDGVYLVMKRLLCLHDLQDIDECLTYYIRAAIEKDDCAEL